MTGGLVWIAGAFRITRRKAFPTSVIPNRFYSESNPRSHPQGCLAWRLRLRIDPELKHFRMTEGAG